jgi:hypothetical protein
VTPSPGTVREAVLRSKQAYRQPFCLDVDTKLGLHVHPVPELAPLMFRDAAPGQGSNGLLGGYVLRMSVRGLEIQVRVTLRLTAGQSVCLGVEPALGLGVGFLAVDSQTTSASGYRASIWDP